MAILQPAIFYPRVSLRIPTGALRLQSDDED